MKTDLLRYAIEKNDVELLRSVFRPKRFLQNYQRRSGDINLVYIASQFCHIDILRFLHEHNVPMDMCVAFFAVKNDRIDMLAFTYEIGIVWDHTITAAVQNGSIECLTYALKNDFLLPSEFVIYPWMLKEFTTRHYICLLILKERKVPIFYEIDAKSAQEVKITIISFAHALKKLHKFVIYRKAHRRVDQYKEELIKKTCHPSRFLVWCLDEDEKREF